MIRDNLVGRTFNRLTVINVLPPDNSANIRTKYICNCSCGKTDIIVEGSKLRNNHTKSCGCLRLGVEPHNKKPYGQAAMNKLINSYYSNAKRKNIIITLTKEQIKKYLHGNCYYCGTEPKKMFSHKKCFGGFLYNGIDRLNNNMGYTIENTVTCCSSCNYFKNRLDYNDFINIICKIYNNLIDKNIIVPN